MNGRGATGMMCSHRIIDFILLEEQVAKNTNCPSAKTARGRPKQCIHSANHQITKSLSHFLYTPTALPCRSAAHHKHLELCLTSLFTKWAIVSLFWKQCYVYHISDLIHKVRIPCRSTIVLLVLNLAKILSTAEFSDFFGLSCQMTF